MKRVLLLAVNDLRLTVRDKPSFFWLLILPVALMAFFAQIPGGSDAPPRISLTVVDQDGGWLARSFVEQLKDETVVLEEVAPEEPDTTEKIRTLVIPEGFTDGVLAGEQQTLRIETEPDASESFGIAAQAHVMRAIVRTLATLTEIDLAGNNGDGADDRMQRFVELAERPPLVELAVSTAGTGQQVPGGRAQSVPGTMTFTVLMMTLIYGAVFLTVEKKSGMLRRQASLPVTRRQIFLGKLLGRLFLAAIQLAILVPVGRFVFGIHFGSSPTGLVLLVGAYALAVGGLATLMGAVLQTVEQAGMIGWIVGLVMAGLGGCWWPAEVMPRWMWNVAHVFPTAWAMDGFHALISFGHGIEAVIVPSAVLAGFGVLFSLVGARFLDYS